MNDFCTNRDANIGKIACDTKMGTPVGFLFGYGSTPISGSDGADLAELLKKTRGDNPSTRLYPLTTAIQSVTDESTEPTVDTQASTGYAEKTADGSVQWAIGYPNTVCLGRQMVRIDKAGFTHVFVVSGGYIWGIPTADGKSLQGFPIASMYLVAASINTDQVRSHVLHINLGKLDEFVSQRSAIKLAYPVSLIEGLTSYKVSPTATGKSFQLLAPCTNEPAFAEVPELASPEAWTVTDGTTGEPIEVSGVTANAGLKSFALTFTEPAGKGTYLVSLAAPSVLEGLGVSGVTSDTLAVKTE